MLAVCAKILAHSVSFQNSRDVAADVTKQSLNSVYVIGCKIRKYLRPDLEFWKQLIYHGDTSGL